jgi:outer membrane protein OmpA-like peptidoglycan-associated protein
MGNDGLRWGSSADRRRADHFFDALIGVGPVRAAEDSSSAQSVDCPPPSPISAICTGLATREVLDCFELGSALVLPRHQPKIVDIARCIVASLASATPIRGLRLVGHTDTSGTATLNRTLGQRRADAVKSAIEIALLSLTGAPLAVTVTTSSRGASDPVPGSPARSRRVEVFAPAPVPASVAPPACACALGADGDALRGRLACTIEQAIQTTSPHDSGATTRAIGPSTMFSGNFDYHSAVHAHWALLNLYRTSADNAGSARTLTRVAEANIDSEWRFLQQPANVAFERPYGRAWFVLLLSELAAAPGRNLAPAQTRREHAERQLLEWLEQNTARAADNGTIGQHGSWLFALLLLVMATPVLPGAGPRIDALYASVVGPARARWRTRVSLASDFLNVPAIIDTLDLLRGRPAQVTATTIAASRIATVAGGHAVGEEMTRLWPVAILARTDPAMCHLLRTRVGEWLQHPEHWEFGPTLPRSPWETRFTDNSHWTPQFLWMAMRLRC